jgi:hypothetical protein
MIRGLNPEGKAQGKGKARQRKRQGKTRHDTTRHDTTKTRQDKTNMRLKDLEPKRKEIEQDQQRDREEVGLERLPSVFMLGTVWTLGSKTKWDESSDIEIQRRCHEKKGQIETKMVQSEREKEKGQEQEEKRRLLSFVFCLK